MQPQKSNGPLEVVSNRQIEVKGLDAATLPPAPTKEEVLREINELGEALRAMVMKAKRVPRVAGLGPHQDTIRCLSQAQNHLQTGIMWLRRSVECPNIF